jgi:hypothetical protein
VDSFRTLCTTPMSEVVVELPKRIGSCIVSVRSRCTEAHALDQGWCHPLGVDHSFVGRNIQMQILLMHTLECPQIRPEGGSCPLAGAATDLADAIPIGIPRPVVYAVADGGVGRMAPRIACHSSV